MAAAGPETPRILVTRKMMPDVEKRAAAAFRATLNADDRPMTLDEVLSAAAHHDGLLLTSFDKLGPDFIPSLPPSIRIIATHSVGYDHLSIPQAKAKGIAVTNTPGVLTDATADIAMLLMLGAARGASWGDRMVRENRWGETTLIAPMGFDVSGKRLGILGMGRIGQAVARRASGFGMELHYHSRNPVAPADHLRRHLSCPPRGHAAPLRFPLDQLRIDARNPRHHQCPRNFVAARERHRGELGTRRHRR
jgi:lactate dehydrogenase-like 2-hydroxyacid dehydrogenase